MCRYCTEGEGDYQAFDLPIVGGNMCGPREAPIGILLMSGESDLNEMANALASETRGIEHRERSNAHIGKRCQHVVNHRCQFGV